VLSVHGQPRASFFLVNQKHGPNQLFAPVNVIETAQSETVQSDETVLPAFSLSCASPMPPLTKQHPRSRFALINRAPSQDFQGCNRSVAQITPSHWLWVYRHPSGLPVWLTRSRSSLTGLARIFRMTRMWRRFKQKRHFPGWRWGRWQISLFFGEGTGCGRGEVFVQCSAVPILLLAHVRWYHGAGGLG
jgi:hypothetical protein